MPRARATAMVAAPTARWPSMRLANWRQLRSGSALLSYISPLRGRDAVALAQDVEVVAAVAGEDVDQRSRGDRVVVGDAALRPGLLVEAAHQGEISRAQGQQLVDQLAERAVGGA